MLLAILIVAILALAATVAFHTINMARIADLHASVTAAYETIEAHIDATRAEDPRVKTLQALLADASAQLNKSNDRVMSLTHPAYLREYRRDQVAASKGQVRETPEFPQYGEFGEEVLPPPRTPQEFAKALEMKRMAPSVAPPDAEPRPAPSRAAS